MTDVSGSVATAWDMARHDEPSLVLSGAWLFLCHPLPVTRGGKQETWLVLTLNVWCSLPVLLFCHFNINLLQRKFTVTAVWTTVNLTGNCYTTVHNSFTSSFQSTAKTSMLMILVPYHPERDQFQNYFNNPSVKLNQVAELLNSDKTNFFVKSATWNVQCDDKIQG